MILELNNNNKAGASKYMNWRVHLEHICMQIGTRN